MRNKIRLVTASWLTLSFALAGCMKSGEEATGVPAGTESVLDASHGGARITLPEIDPTALGKLGASALPDSGAKAWFQLSITGENMPGQAYLFPLTGKGGQTFEIKGIPAGKKRSFHGSLLNAGKVVTHEGITLADIQAGAYTDVRLFLAKANGSANVCVTIEGQTPPPCASDSLPPKPVPDSIGAIPMPGSGASQTTLCFEMRFDYGSGCELQGYAKMSFLNGTITYGDILVTDKPVRDYTRAMGQYDSSNISFYAVTREANNGVFDTLSLKGRIGLGATMAKGDYLREPSGKQGNWTMKVVACGASTAVYPDSSCFASAH
jgi:hypothetical protein